MKAKYRIVRSDDVEKAREIHRLAFKSDAWVGDTHTYWFAFDANDQPVGWASAIYFPHIGCAYLSRAAVAKAARGSGLHRRLVMVRVRWAWKQNAKWVVTYVSRRNFASFVNLVYCGFRFSKHYFKDGIYQYFVMFKTIKGQDLADERALIRQVGKLI